MQKPLLDETAKRISLLQFGAKGDGKQDDTEALRTAIRTARSDGVILEFPKGEYRTNEIVELEGITLISQGAAIYYYGTHMNSPAINMHDDVKIFGKLTIWAADNTKDGTVNHGNRCAMAFGVYDSGEGAHHCYVEDLTVLAGGMPNANAVFITGDSSDITIERVTVPAGTDVYRGVLVHWGNAQDHFPKGGTWSVENGYGHAENWKPTQHPHDLHFGVIDCSGIEDTGINDSRAAFHIAAGYDIEADEVIMNDGFHAVCITGADQGFLYASPEVQAVGGQRNIRIGKVKGRRLHDTGLYIASHVLMNNTISVNTELTVDEVDLEASSDCKKVAIGLNSVDSVRIGKATVKGYNQSALYVGKNNRLVEVGELNVEFCTADAVAVCEYARNAPKSGDVRIGTLNIRNSGGKGKSAIRLHQFETFSLDAVHTENVNYKHLVLLENDYGFTSAHIGMLDGSGMNGLQAAIGTEQKGGTVAVDRLLLSDAVPEVAGEPCKIFVKATERR